MMSFSRKYRKEESGNVLFMMMVVIALLAILTAIVSKSSEQQSDTIPRQTADNEINQILTQAATLGGAINQMLLNGDDPATLYSSLSMLKPGDAGFETAPHDFKIYHPYGGGIKYMADSGANAVGTAFNIVPAAIVKGVGQTDATTGDILFTATISGASYCQRINQILTGSATVPVMANAAFTSLFTNGTALTIDNTNCASCVNASKICVSNATGNAWGFYSALLPG